MLNIHGQNLRECKPLDLDNSFISMHCVESVCHGATNSELVKTNQ